MLARNRNVAVQEKRDGDEGHEREREVDEEHGHEDEADLQQVPCHADDPLRDELPQRLQVVGEVGERVAHRRAVEEVVGEGQHLAEQVHPEIQEEPLAEVLDAVAGDDLEGVPGNHDERQEDARSCASPARSFCATSVSMACFTR